MLVYLAWLLLSDEYWTQSKYLICYMIKAVKADFVCRIVDFVMRPINLLTCLNSPHHNSASF